MARLPTDRMELGRLGEVIAARFLSERDVIIVARNVATAAGEIDVLASIDGEMTAVEVRSARRSDPDPELMSYAKERQVRRVAASLEPPVFRVDLVTVLFGLRGVRVRWHRRV